MVKRVRYSLLISLLAFTAIASELPATRIVNKGVMFPEGPIFHLGTLYYVGMSGSGVLAWDGNSNKAIYNEKECGPTAVHPFGVDLIVACYSSGEFVTIRTDGTVLKRMKKDISGALIRGPNDFAADGKGGVYATGSGSADTTVIDGKVYHITPNLRVTEVAGDIHYANGIAISPDGKRLMVGEPEAQRVISFATNSGGNLDKRLSDRRLFTRVNKEDPEGGIDAYPDGIKFSPDGDLWVGEYTKGRVAVFSSAGKFLRGYDFPGEQACTNIAFREDRKAVAVTCVGDVVHEPYPGTVYLMDLPAGP